MILLSSDPVISFEESAEKANERTVIAWPIGQLNKFDKYHSQSFTFTRDFLKVYL